MNGKNREAQIAQALQEQASQAVPDDFDPWPAMLTRLAVHNPTSQHYERKPNGRLAWGSMALVLLVMLAGIGYLAMMPPATYTDVNKVAGVASPGTAQTTASIQAQAIQTQPAGQPGQGSLANRRADRIHGRGWDVQLAWDEAGRLLTHADHLERDGLVHRLDMKQEIEGHEVTVQWVYADGNRVAVAFMLDNYKVDGGQIVPYQIYLFDSKDASKTYMWLRTEQMGKVGEPTGYIAYFDATYVEGAPETLDLRLSLYLQAVPNRETLIITAGTPIPEATYFARRELSMPKHQAGPFELNFSVPFVPARVVEVGKESTVKSAFKTEYYHYADPMSTNPKLETKQWEESVTLILDTVRVAPSGLVAVLDPGSLRGWKGSVISWNPEVELKSANLKGVPGSLDTRATAHNDTEGTVWRLNDGYGKWMCIWLGSLYAYKGEWTLTVPQLFGWADAGAQYTAQGPWEFRFKLEE